MCSTVRSVGLGLDYIIHSTLLPYYIWAVGSNNIASLQQPHSPNPTRRASGVQFQSLQSLCACSNNRVFSTCIGPNTLIYDIIEGGVLTSPTTERSKFRQNTPPLGHLLWGAGPLFLNPASSRTNRLFTPKMQRKIQVNIKEHFIESL